MSSASCASVQLIASADELEWSLISDGGAVAITAAASTPESTVREIVDALAGRFSLQVEEVGSALEKTVFKPLAVA